MACASTLGGICLLDPALCGGGNIPRQLAAGSTAATLIRREVHNLLK
jgi:hypothetical protein